MWRTVVMRVLHPSPVEQAAAATLAYNIAAIARPHALVTGLNGQVTVRPFRRGQIEIFRWWKCNTDGLRAFRGRPSTMAGDAGGDWTGGNRPGR